ncbi:hypothetical protein WJX72_007112 [[Myrmecia] bisecta]|uniref:Dual specificity protein phosphatase n=1 Tax=[Myrmecia] bisecta TaxID=41462 RepID=A0AAW1QG20_9CHLO
MIGGIVSLSGNEFTPEMLQEYGIKQLDLPVRDGFTPSLSQVKQFEAFVDDVHGSSGKATVVHCLAGLGRTGTMLAAYCMLKDPSLSAGEAVQRVRALRPGSVETYRQVQFLRELQEHLNKPAAPQAHYVDE